jgi:acetylornithine deacetylase/succinyl-diaminopimelate desuccinylase-like protein
MNKTLAAISANPLRTLPLAIVMAAMLAVPLLASGQTFSELPPHEQLSEDILRELVGYESTVERPDEVLKSLQAMALRLREAGFAEEDIQLVTPAENLHGLVVRYRGIGSKRPVLLLAHIDVVTANPDAWAFPPFSLGKKDGYYVGRGTEDNKGGVTQIFSNFIRLKREGWVPKRDLIAAITGDEETTGLVATWFANEGRDLVDAEYAINSDAGGGEYDEAGNRLAFWVQNSEKIYYTVELTATNDGGHSSLPRPENAIQDLAVAITRLANYQFPVRLNDGTRMELQRSASMQPDNIARDMLALAEDDNDTAAAERLSAHDASFNAMLHTTCTPTLLRGGHAENALPRDATVTVNCRILPGTPVSEIKDVIIGLTDDLNVAFKVIYDGISSDPSIMPDAFLESIESLVETHWGEVAVIPSMSTGATDGLFYRNAGLPVYGINAMFSKPSDWRAHGLDERVGISDFHESVAFWYDLLKTVAKK